MSTANGRTADHEIDEMFLNVKVREIWCKFNDNSIAIKVYLRGVARIERSNQKGYDA